ncbi:hypothetical protein HHK36_028071 [Tetracentron sinense]|uniref:VASt domain-containing protein n=1 Tax=Tetracentron sinense TaxID=13715 RepID=A0A834YF52_TETSI|nr:hypothetical protein HHK36_028071 [Tetracentron sinense]
MENPMFDREECVRIKPIQVEDTPSPGKIPPFYDAFGVVTLTHNNFSPLSALGAYGNALEEARLGDGYYPIGECVDGGVVLQPGEDSIQAKTFNKPDPVESSRFGHLRSPSLAFSEFNSKDSEASGYSSLTREVAVHHLLENSTGRFWDLAEYSDSDATLQDEISVDVVSSSEAVSQPPSGSQAPSCSTEATSGGCGKSLLLPSSSSSSARVQTESLPCLSNLTEIKASSLTRLPGYTPTDQSVAIGGRLLSSSSTVVLGLSPWVESKLKGISKFLGLSVRGREEELHKLFKSLEASNCGMVGKPKSKPRQSLGSERRAQLEVRRLKCDVNYDRSNRRVSPQSKRLELQKIALRILGLTCTSSGCERNWSTFEHKTIPFHEVTCVRKAKTAAIFPNAIEIVAGEKKHFFASFLSRDEAYRLIVDGWSQQNNGAKTIIDRQDSKSELRSQDNGLIIFETSKSSTRTVNDLNSVDGNKDTHISEECKLLSNGEDDIRVLATLSEARENGDEDAEPAVNGVECLSSGKPLTWKLEDADSPKIPEYYTKVAESKYPIKVEEFFNLFFSDDAVNFIELFHRKCGDKDFRCTSWYQHEQFGHARDVSFQHPIKIYFGAKFGSCQEVQKFRVYRNRGFGMWSKMVMKQINVAFCGSMLMWHFLKEPCGKACELLEQRNLGTLEGESPTVSTIQHDDFQFERQAKTEGPSERFHETSNLKRISQLASDSSDVNQQSKPPSFSLSHHLRCDPSSDAGKMVRLKQTTRKSFTRPWIVHPPPEPSVSMRITAREYRASLVVPPPPEPTYVVQPPSEPIRAIPLRVVPPPPVYVQLSIVVLLTRAPQVHIISQTEYMYGIGSGEGDRAEAISWLEKRVHHLKDEMLMVEARMEKMRHEHLLLKAHLQDLELLKKRKHYSTTT